MTSLRRVHFVVDPMAPLPALSPAPFPRIPMCPVYWRPQRECDTPSPDANYLCLWAPATQWPIFSRPFAMNWWSACIEWCTLRWDCCRQTVDSMSIAGYAIVANWCEGSSVAQELLERLNASTFRPAYGKWAQFRKLLLSVGCGDLNLPGRMSCSLGKCTCPYRGGMYAICPAPIPFRRPALAHVSYICAAE